MEIVEQRECVWKMADWQEFFKENIEKKRYASDQ